MSAIDALATMQTPLRIFWTASVRRGVGGGPSPGATGYRKLPCLGHDDRGTIGRNSSGAIKWCKTTGITSLQDVFRGRWVRSSATEDHSNMWNSFSNISNVSTVSLWIMDDVCC